MYLLNEKTKLLGVDVFVAQKTIPVIETPVGKFKLEFVANRGSKVWPGKPTNTELADVFQCRFMSGSQLTHSDVTAFLAELDKLGWEWVHIEKLLEFSGKPGF